MIALSLSALLAVAEKAPTTPPPAPPLAPATLSLVCQVKDWAPPAFAPGSDAARASFNDADRKFADDFEQSLSNKSAERDDGNLSAADFDRFAERALRDAVKQRADLRPILSSIALHYSHNVGIDYLLERDNERALAQHDASTQAKPYLNHYVQLHLANNEVTWQETMQRLADKAMLNVPDPRTGLTPTLTFDESRLVFTLQPKAEDTLSQKTVATIDRYSGELLLEKSNSGGRLLFSLSGICSTQDAPKF